jgi:predicted acetyltransferase
MRDIDYGTPSSPAEIEALTEIIIRAFGGSPERIAGYVKRLGVENFRVARVGGAVAGTLGIYHMGQWFGGKSIPMAGIAAVGVAPEHRGTGVARQLMCRVLGELRDADVSISTLYPSTQRLYRRVGYEQAGHRCLIAVDADSVVLGERTVPMYPVDPEHHRVFHELYRERARRVSGNLDRNNEIWRRVVESESDTERAYASLVGPKERPEGYIVFTQPRQRGGYDLSVQDLVALTPRAALRLLTFIGDHRSEAKEVIWAGPVKDPLLALLPEQAFRMKRVERWHLRILDVPIALTLRGYPDVDRDGEELHLEIRDEIIESNTGRFLLRVSSGRGEVARGGRGDLKLDIGGLAPLFSGFFTPYELASIGLLEASESALAVATRIFAGPEPWMPDGF